MEKKYTKGPWDAGTWRKTYRKYSADHNGTFCLELGENAGSPMVCHNEEWEANGTLSLTAPDLLEALESHCNLCATDNGIDVKNCLPEICNTKKVIAKAHGIS